MLQRLKQVLLIMTIILGGTIPSLMAEPIATETTSGNPAPNSLLAALESISCDALIDELTQIAIAEMEARVDKDFMERITGYGLCGYAYPGYYWEDDASFPAEEQIIDPGYDVPDAAPSPTAGAGDAASDAAEPSASEYSETNVQVAGVDEADFVKNDGSRIYILSNGKFRIVAAWPPENAQEISSFPIEGIPRKLFVHNNIALIYSSLDPIPSQDTASYSDAYYGTSECTYGYDCEFTGDGRELKMTFLDLTNLTAPVLKREIYFPGSFLNARRIDDIVHTAIVFPEPGIQTFVSGLDDAIFKPFCDWQSPLTFNDLIERVEAFKKEKREAILKADLEDWLPVIRDIQYKGSAKEEKKQLLTTCDNFYRTQQQDGMNFISVVSFVIDQMEAPDTATLFGKPGAVYASQDALYIASKQTVQKDVPWFFEDVVDITEATTLHKFTLTDAKPFVRYAASGVVKGRGLNQFSMDEHNGYFRIATTTGHLPSPKVHSTLSIMQDQVQALRVVGQIDQIAPQEDIRSVRFLGAKAYVVTFKKTDPLFVFDLSDPLNPVVAGELKIPGFSTYIHPLNADHLLTIGYDADDQGDFAWFQGIMLQIFNVADMANPVLAHKEVIGTRGSTSEATTNHLAFNYFGSRGLLAIPITICEGENEYGGQYGDLMTFSGLLVYKVDSTNGFELLGGVPHVAPETRDNYRYACNNWWTESNSYVKRSIFMDDYVYSISDDTIKIQNLDALGVDVAVIYFVDQPLCDPFHVGLCVDANACFAANGAWRDGYCGLLPYGIEYTKVPCGPAELSSDLHLHVPVLSYAYQGQRVYQWLDFEYSGQYEAAGFELMAYGEVDPPADNCETAVLTPDFHLTIPKITYQTPIGLGVSLWLDLVYKREQNTGFFAIEDGGPLVED